jgi:hypothetical protein
MQHQHIIRSVHPLLQYKSVALVLIKQGKFFSSSLNLNSEVGMQGGEGPNQQIYQTTTVAARRKRIEASFVPVTYYNIYIHVSIYHVKRLHALRARLIGPANYTHEFAADRKLESTMTMISR